MHCRHAHQTLKEDTIHKIQLLLIAIERAMVVLLEDSNLAGYSFPMKISPSEKEVRQNQTRTEPYQIAVFFTSNRLPLRTAVDHRHNNHTRAHNLLSAKRKSLRTTVFFDINIYCEALGIERKLDNKYLFLGSRIVVISQCTGRMA